MNRRLLKEIQNLYKEQNNKPLLDNNYIIHYDDDDINKIKVLIRAPEESVYKHKFVRLDITIPNNYPHSPPDVQFVNHDGVRIHPNMYDTGKCCATILNTWGTDKYEKWTSSMGIETIILTFHSFLDNHPYMYEPGNRDDPSYTTYVKYQSWITCLIRYLEKENIEIFQEYINNYVLLHLGEIFNELFRLKESYPYGWYYTKCFEIDHYTINYNLIIDALQSFLNTLEYKDNNTLQIELLDNNAEYNYKCDICYDTEDIGCDRNHNEYLLNETFYKLNCFHKFHRKCLMEHINNNNNVCPMCRYEITENEVKKMVEDDIKYDMRDDPELWIINPLTKRKVKKGSKTYKNLIKNGIIDKNEL